MGRFRLHQAFNITGAISVIAGAAIAFARLGDTLEAVGGDDHKIAGVIAFIGVLLLPIAGFIRPKKAGPGVKRSKLRIVWVRCLLNVSGFACEGCSAGCRGVRMLARCSLLRGRSVAARGLVRRELCMHTLGRVQGRAACICVHALRQERAPALPACLHTAMK